MSSWGDDKEAIKKSILEKLNAKIRQSRDADLDGKSYETTSSAPLLKTMAKRSELDNRYLSKFKAQIEQTETKLRSVSKDKSSFQAVIDSDSCSTLSSKKSFGSGVDMAKIKSSGRVRDLLAQKRQQEEKVVYKPPWTGVRGSQGSISSPRHSSKPLGKVVLVPTGLTGYKRRKPSALSQSSIVSRKSQVKTNPKAMSARSSATSSAKSSSRPETRSTVRTNNASAQSRSSSASEAILKRASSSRASTALSTISRHASDTGMSSDEAQSNKSDKPAKKSINVPKSTKWNFFSRTNPVKVAPIIPKNENIETPTNPKSKKVEHAPVKKSLNQIISVKKDDIPSPSPKNSKDMDEEEGAQQGALGGIAKCKHCSRPFNKDRIELHEKICLKTLKAKASRGNFDTKKMRVKGTELENITKRSKSAPPASAKNSNWRKAHEELVTSLREAKKIQAHITKGGKASDFPAAPAKNDGKECPHCARKFSEASWERHTQICGNLKNFRLKK